ncbi:MAG: hypothetical protein QOG80_2622 [Pseudonocardiales bacterium]|nr:hypothetical protein [Pseudonocardiales bacterium]
MAVVLVVTGACSSVRPARAAPASVVGTVLSGPRCPVERVGSPCPPGPVSGADVAALSGGRIRAATKSDGRGGFRLTVPPGSYTITATNVGAYRSTATQQVVVAPGQTVSISLLLDTGIR